MLHLLSLTEAKNRQREADAAANLAYAHALAQRRTPVQGAPAAVAQDSSSFPTPNTPGRSASLQDPGPGSSGAELKAVRASPRQAAARSSPALGTPAGISIASPGFDLAAVQHWRRKPSKCSQSAIKLVAPAVSSPRLFGLRQQLDVVDYWPKQVQ